MNLYTLHTGFSLDKMNKIYNKYKVPVHFRFCTPEDHQVALNLLLFYFK